VKSVKIPVPLVVRLEGTNVELGRKILQDSGLPIITADLLADAAQKVVQSFPMKLYLYYENVQQPLVIEDSRQRTGWLHARI